MHWPPRARSDDETSSEDPGAETDSTAAPRARRFTALLLLVYGLLPIWAGLVWSASLGGVAGFALASPFAVAVALPYSGVTLLVALVGIGVYKAVRGDHGRKRRLALLTILLPTVILAAHVALRWTQDQKRDVALHDVQRMAVEFASEMARRDGLHVTRAVLHSSELDVSGSPTRFDVYVDGGKVFYAVVEVKQALSGNPSFRLLCTTSLSPAARDSHRHPCEQGK